ncbi:hypothetical protein Csa_005327 [Cucumis sativus]|nr:hypothetical protein Csa_005327 [Cucumis sativus]
MAAYSSMARVAGRRRAWARALLFRLHTRPRHKTLMRRKRRPSTSSDDMVGKLRRLLPGGETMDVCTLLEETANYIHCLSTQVKVMKAISNHHLSKCPYSASVQHISVASGRSIKTKVSKIVLGPLRVGKPQGFIGKPNIWKDGKRMRNVSEVTHICRNRSTKRIRERMRTVLEVASKCNHRKTKMSFNSRDIKLERVGQKSKTKRI